jgi:photosystem II stability/assembly factor-like uncharacterized protein
MKKSNLFLLVTLTIPAIICAQDIQWEQLSGPHGSAVYSVVSDNAGNVYANTMWGAGPFKSNDDGENWFSIKRDLTPYYGEFQPLNINSNGDLFIGGAHNTASLCRSSDGGNTWEPLNNLNTNQGSVICISFDADDNIYLGTGTGIYKSTDNGDNWALYGNFTSQTEAIAFNSSGHVFAGTSYGVYRSSDNGTIWTQLPTGGGTRTVAVAPNGDVFAGCWENGGILKSTDNGDSWSYSYPQTVQIRSASTIHFDDNGDIYFPTYGQGILKSVDNGDTWIELSEGLGYKYLRAIAENLSGSLFTGGDYALYKSHSSGSNWYSVGLSVCSVKKIAINSNDEIFAGVWGVNRSLDRGQSWETINNGLSNLEVKEITIKNDGTIFLGCGINGPCIFRSTDNGNSWTAIENEIQRHDVEAIAVDISGNVYAGNYYGVYKSSNNGDNWVNIGGAAGAKELCFNSIGDLFLASWGGGFWKLPAGETTWVDLTSIVNSSWNWSMLIGTNDYIYAGSKRSTDNGITWEEISYPGPYICYAENSVGNIFIGTRSYGTGIWRSSDFGESWESINTYLPTLEIWSLAIDSDDYLYAGTDGYSMLRTTTSTVTSVDELNSPADFQYLKQNYPNPFNPTTTISWQLPINAHVVLKVYDFTGRELSTLADCQMAKGEHSVAFNALNLPAGIYFCQLQVNGRIETKKMVQLK